MSSQRTHRQIRVDRAILRALENIPPGFLIADEILRADARRLMIPAPTTAELDEAILHADTLHRITGVVTEECVKYKISPVGHAWLAENP